MNTTQLENIVQKVIDNDSFGIVKDYVKAMEKFDKKEKEKTEFKFVRVLDQLNFLTRHIRRDDQFIEKDPAISSAPRV